MLNDDYLNMFISAKDIEGRSSKTLKYYKDIILKFIRHIEKPIKEILHIFVVSTNKNIAKKSCTT